MAETEVLEGRAQLRLEDLLILLQGGGLPAGAVLFDPRRGENSEQWCRSDVRLSFAAIPCGEDFALDPDSLVTDDSLVRLLPEPTVDVVPAQLVSGFGLDHGHGSRLLCSCGDAPRPWSSCGAV